MNRDLQTKLDQYAKARKKKRKWLTVIASLCAVVAFSTSYILINPADTSQQETFCGIEEHKEHTDDCYEKVLVCQLSEEGHMHSESCYEEKQALTCTLPETDGHTHLDTCFGTEEYFSCETEETDGHQHSEECYETESVLICGNADEEHIHTDECYEDEEILKCQLEECEPHHHDENCYSTRQVLICKEEVKPSHYHGENCYEIQTVCKCGMEECAPHQHSEECFEINYENLLCEIPIHEHTLQCFSNPMADLETASVWEQTFSDVELTGKWNEDVLAIAQTQLGYTESIANYEVQEDGTTMNGYTRYGDWYGIVYGDWCAMFGSFCLHYAGVDSELIPLEASCQRWIEKLSDPEYDLYREAGTGADTYIPEPGDLIFIDWDALNPEDPGTREVDHVGIVAEIMYDTDTRAIQKIKTIEGNFGDAVCENIYEITDSRILGYGILPDNPNEPLEFPPCDCWNEGLPLISHSDQCARKSSVKSMCNEYTAEELFQVWSQLPEDMQVFALEYLGWSYEGQQKREELQKLLEEGLPNPDESEEEGIVKTVEGDGFTVRVEYDENAGLPESVVLHAVAIEADSEQYQSDYQQMIEELLAQGYAEDEESLQISYARIFDIGFYSEEGKVEPKTPVRIEIRCDDNVQMSSEECALAVHFGEAGTEVLNTEVCFAEDECTVQSFRFIQNGFSDTAIVIAELPQGTNAVIFDGTNGIVSSVGATAGESYYKGAKKIQVSLTNGMCILPTTADIKTASMEHNYKIAGWYDVVNGNYYGEELLDGETLVEIQGPETPYFYADWIDADYSPSGAENSIDTPYIGNFVTTRFFDYNELFNIPHATLKGAASSQPVKGYTYSGWNFDTANPGLIFYADNYDGSRDYDCTSGTGHLGSIYHNGTPDKYKYADNVTTGLYSEEEIRRLFAPENNTLGKTYVGEADHFYMYDPETGYYEYDSEKNAATYNKNDGRVYLYNNKVKVGNSNTYSSTAALQSDGFLPFNKGNDTSITYPTTGGRANYWFGMSSEIQFYLPSNSGTGSQNKVNGQNMVFNFSGDDDVWVLVDDELVLDIGGIHPRADASIDFATGVCKVGSTSKTLSFSEGPHTLTIYYMERGGNQSNCRIQFNIVPTYDLILTKKENDENGRILNGAAFSIYSDEECTQPVTSLYKLLTTGEKVPVNTNVFADADDGETDGVIRCTGLVPGTVYYLRETTAPAGFTEMQDNFTIKLDLNHEGKATVVALDKDGRQYWDLTNAYSIDEENNMRILLDVFNNVYIGGETEIYVNKVWDDGDQILTHEEEEIWIKLLAKKAEETEYTDSGIRIALNDANGWQNAFINLQKYYTDEEGLHEFDYTVEEIVPEGYSASTQAAEIEIAQDAYWKPATSLEAGKTYRFVAANGRALAASSNSAITSKVSDEEVLDQQWKAVSNGTSGIALESAVYNGRYLNTSRRFIWGYQYSASLSATKQNVSYSGSTLQVGSYYITVSNTSASANTAANGTALTAYELVAASTSTVPGFTITNTAVPGTVSVNIQKVDQGQQPIRIEGVTFSVYGSKEEIDGVNADEVKIVPDMDNLIGTCVTDANGQAMIEELTAGEIYWIIETRAPDGYLIMPEPHAFMATDVTDDGNFEVIDYNDAYLVNKDGTMLIINYNGYKLPDTGGIGSYPIYTLGAVLITGSLMCGYKLRRRRERRAE